MIRHVSAAVLVLLAAMLGLAPVPAASAAANLVSNPGFEAGALSGWTCSAQGAVAGSPVHSGSHALGGGATSSDDAQCSQVIPVQPSSSYTLSAWVEGNYVYLGDTGTGTSDTSTWTPSAAAWQQLSTAFTTGAATTSVTIYLHGWYAQGTYYADDVALAGPGGSPPSSPAVPAGLTVTGVTSSSASLTWTEASGSDPATSYDVYENGVLAATARTTSATVTGLAPGTTYQFTVAAVDAAGNASAPSAAVSATTSGTGGSTGGGNWRSPVYLMPLDNNPPGASQIAGIMAATVDFDIENTALGDTGNEIKRFQAIATLERQDPGLTVSLTIPVTSIGLPDTGKSEIQQAIAAGARIDVLGIMDFDYGLTSGTQVSSDEAVASDVASQLESLYGWPAATVWSHIGITLMNGHTDQPSELFTQATFTSLLSFAQANHAAWLSFWSFNRDQPCPAGAQEPWAPGTCSNISQSPYDFTKIVAQYAG